MKKKRLIIAAVLTLVGLILNFVFTGQQFLAYTLYFAALVCLLFGIIGKTVKRVICVLLALGLAYLAFVLEFPTIAKGIKEISNPTRLGFSQSGFQSQKAQKDLAELALHAAKLNPWDKQDPTELRGDRPTYYKVPNGTPLGYYKSGSSSIGWGSRGGKSSSNLRSSW